MTRIWIWIAATLLQSSYTAVLKTRSSTEKPGTSSATGDGAKRPECDNIGERCGPPNQYYPVDAIWTWVNGSDAAYMELMESYRQNISEAKRPTPKINRVADNDELRYSIRSLYKFAPWVRNIYLYTNGQIPWWLDIRHPRIKVVTHAQAFRDKSHLPTFNSQAIDANMHYIEGLSEHYLYLNDDFLIGKPIVPEDWITPVRGYKIRLAWPCPRCIKEHDMWALSLCHTNKLYTSAFGTASRNVMPHAPRILNRTIMQELEKRFPGEFRTTSSNRFRAPNDLELSFAYFYYLIYGNYKHEMVNDHEERFSPLVSNVAKAKKNFDDIINNPRKFNCLNDDLDHNSETMQEIYELYSEFHERMFPEISPFEYQNEKMNEYLHIQQYNISKLRIEEIKNTGYTREEAKKIALVDHNTAKQSTEEMAPFISDKNTGKLVNIRLKVESFYSGIGEMHIAIVLTLIVLVIMCTFVIRSRVIQTVWKG